MSVSGIPSSDRAKTQAAGPTVIVHQHFYRPVIRFQQMFVADSSGLAQGQPHPQQTRTQMRYMPKAPAAAPQPVQRAQARPAQQGQAAGAPSQRSGAPQLKRIDREFVLRTDLRTDVSVEQQKKRIDQNPIAYSARVREIQREIENTQIPHAYKTTLCASCESEAECRYGDRCLFAHSVIAQLAFSSYKKPQYKTKECPDAGDCPFYQNGKCHRVHPGDLMHDQVHDVWKLYRPQQAASREASSRGDSRSEGVPFRMSPPALVERPVPAPHLPRPEARPPASQPASPVAHPVQPRSLPFETPAPGLLFAPRPAPVSRIPTAPRNPDLEGATTVASVLAFMDNLTDEREERLEIDELLREAVTHET